MTTPTQDDFWSALNERFEVARAAGQTSITVTAGDLHRSVGGYPGTNHRMPVCCQVMRDAMKASDRVVAEPPSGKGASLAIEYQLSR